jgi:6-phosphogluconate dehydrogenase
MKLGFLGLGKMGTRMVEKLLREGHEVVVWNRSKDVVEEFLKSMTDKKLDGKLSAKDTVADAVSCLESPKVIWSMLPSGDASEQILKEVLGILTSEKDSGEVLIPSGGTGMTNNEAIVIDGANANFHDTERRANFFKEKHIRFLGIGVSGGVIAEKEGYPMMVGGDKSAYEEISSLLDSLAKPNGGHAYFGTGGAGHFVKMVHNGIEYGMMQAIGEGFGVLEKAPYDIDLLEVSKLWQHGTIVDSFLIDRARDALEKNNTLSDVVGEIDATGEGEWTIEEAKKEGVPIENIEQSLDFRRRSKIDPTIRDSFAAKMVAALRREFGGHAVKKKNE